MPDYVLGKRDHQKIIGAILADNRVSTDDHPKLLEELLEALDDAQADGFQQGTSQGYDNGWAEAKASDPAIPDGSLIYKGLRPNTDTPGVGFFVSAGEVEVRNRARSFAPFWIPVGDRAIVRALCDEMKRRLDETEAVEERERREVEL